MAFSTAGYLLPLGMSIDARLRYKTIKDTPTKHKLINILSTNNSLLIF